MFHCDPNTHVATKKVFVEVNVLACEEKRSPKTLWVFCIDAFTMFGWKKLNFVLCSRVNKNDAEVNTHTFDSAGITNMGSLMYDGHAHGTRHDVWERKTTYLLHFVSWWSLLWKIEIGDNNTLRDLQCGEVNSRHTQHLGIAMCFQSDRDHD